MKNVFTFPNFPQLPQNCPHSTFFTAENVQILQKYLYLKRNSDFSEISLSKTYFLRMSFLCFRTFFFTSLNFPLFAPHPRSSSSSSFGSSIIKHKLSQHLPTCSSIVFLFLPLPTASLSSHLPRPPLRAILNKTKTKQRKRKAKGSERRFLPPRRRSSLCVEQSGPLLTQTDEADTTLAQIVFSCRFFPLPPSPPLSCLHLVLTLMLTKRFVKQDLSGGRKTRKQTNRRGRSDVAALRGLRSTPGQLHSV